MPHSQAAEKSFWDQAEESIGADFQQHKQPTEANVSPQWSESQYDQEKRGGEANFKCKEPNDDNESSVMMYMPWCWMSSIFY